jgi:hypothetical protein
MAELIQGYAIAMQAEATEHELMETICPHRCWMRMGGTSKRRAQAASARASRSDAIRPSAT